MADDVIKVDGEEKVVREDTAKSYRGTIWILIVVGIVLATAAILFFGFGLGAATNGTMQSPGQIENSSRR